MNPTFFVEPGQQFGRLVVQEAVSTRTPDGKTRRAARCLCECGTEVTVLLQHLKGHTRSCGCMKKGDTMSETFRQTRGRPRLFSIEAGQRFGRLVVVEEMKVKKTWSAICRCDCGSETTVTVNNLKSGTSKSCGCLQREIVATLSAERTTHAMSNHEHYPRWSNMLHRCEDPLNSHYEHYGARGISVCEEWHDVVAFVDYLETVLGPRPEGHSFDRIDNDGNYEPGNVRWASALEQRHNQRRGAAWGKRASKS